MPTTMNKETPDMTDKLTVSINHSITVKDLQDVLCTALEGGIGYWSMADKIVRNADGEYESVRLWISEVDDDAFRDELEVHKKRITKTDFFGTHVFDCVGVDLKAEDLLIGLQAVLAKGLRRDLIEQIHQALEDEDETLGYVDADVADCIVQASIFKDGEVIFG